MADILITPDSGLIQLSGSTASKYNNLSVLAEGDVSWAWPNLVSGSNGVLIDFKYNNSSKFKITADGVDINGSLGITDSSLVNNLNADLLDGVHAIDLKNNTHTSFEKIDLSNNWHTIAYNAGDRASARFGLRDMKSSNHQSVVFYATHHFGVGNQINILSHGAYTDSLPIKAIRIKKGGTYDGALLQVQIQSGNGNQVEAFLLGDNFQLSSGWVLVDWVLDGVNPGLSQTKFDNLTDISVIVDLQNTVRTGGMLTSGEMYVNSNSKVYNDNYHPLADRWAANISLNLTGDITGTVAFNGSSDVTLPATISSNFFKYYGVSSGDVNDFLSRGSTYTTSTATNSPILNANILSWGIGSQHAQLGVRGDRMYVRDRINNTWRGWQQVFSDIYHPNADKWTSPINITVGDTLKSIDGSSNISWSTEEIGITKTNIDLLGINADTIDSLDSTQFLRSDVDDTATGAITINNTVSANRFLQRNTGIPVANLGTPSVTEMALFEEQFNNKTEFYSPSNVSIFSSNDGISWTEDAAVTDVLKQKLMGGDDTGQPISLPHNTPYYMIQIDNNGHYVYLNALYMYMSTQGNEMSVKIKARRHSDSEYVWIANSSENVSGWPRHLYLPFQTVPFSNNNHYNQVQIIFEPNWLHATNDIILYKLQMWGGYPASKRRLFSVDHLKNARFPSALGADSLNINGTSIINASRVLSNITQATIDNIVLDGNGISATTGDLQIGSGNNTVNLSNELSIDNGFIIQNPGVISVFKTSVSGVDKGYNTYDWRVSGEGAAVHKINRNAAGGYLPYRERWWDSSNYIDLWVSNGKFIVDNNLFTSGSFESRGTSTFGGNLTLEAGVSISFNDTRGVFPTNTGSAFKWVLNNDSAEIYAYQSSSDRIDFVSKITDNLGTTDRWVFWIDNFQGQDSDGYPLMMDGTNVVVNAPKLYGGAGGAADIDFKVLSHQATSTTTTPLFHVDVSEDNVIINGKLNVSNESNLQNVTINGNLTVLGSTLSSSVETVLIQDNLITLNDGEAGDGVTAGYAGVEIDRGPNTDNYWFVFRESDNKFVTGVSGSLQTVATRMDDSVITDKGIPFFNIDLKRLDNSSSFVWDNGGVSINGHLNVDNLKLDGNTLSTTNTDGNLLIQLSGNGSMGVNGTPVDAIFQVSGQNANFYSNDSTQVLRVGRNINEHISLQIEDNRNYIIAYQDDDTNGLHEFILDRRFEGTGPNDFIIQKDGVAQFLINKDGNIGLGTTTPTERLEVNGNIKISNNTISPDSVTFDGGSSIGARISNVNGYVSITPLNTGWAHIYTDRSNFIFNRAVYAIGGKFHSYNTADLTLNTSATTRLTIKNSTGNVGVNTTAPAYKLDINGDGRFSTNLIVSGSSRLKQAVVFDDSITTPTFASGFAGYGARLNLDENNEWHLGIDNLTVRGRMRIYELLINQIRATNGSVWVSSTGEVETVWSGSVSSSLANPGVHAPSDYPSNGLQIYYTFNENNNTEAFDYTGNNYTGDIVGCTVIDGEIGKSVSLDGVTGGLYLPLSATADFIVDKSFSIEVWVKTDGYIYQGNSAWNTIVGFNGLASVNSMTVAVDNVNKVNTYVGTTGRFFNEPITPGEYMQVVMVVDYPGNRFKTYINGELKDNFYSTINHINNLATRVTIGDDTGNPTRHLDADFESIRLYNRDLSDNEIKALYQNRGGIRVKTAEGTNHGFLEGDLIRAQRFTGTGVYRSDGLVGNVKDTTEFYIEPMSSDLPEKDFEYVRIGNVQDKTRQGAVYLTSDDSGAPFIDVIDGIDSFSTFNSAGTQKVRVGKLDGIVDASLGLNSVSDVYGIYTEAGYFRGNIIVGGNVEQATIAENTIALGNIIGEANSSIKISLTSDLISSGFFTYNDVGENVLKLPLSGSSKIAGWYLDGNNIWSGNQDIDNTNNKVILSSNALKIVLGNNANSLNLNSSEGVFLSGSGEFNLAKNANNYIRSTTDSLEIKSTNVTLSSSNVSINTPNFYLGGTNNYISGSSGNIKIKSTNDFELSSSNVQISSSLFRLKNNFTWNGTSLFISGSSVQVITPSFLLGNSSNYVSGSGGNIVISGSNVKVLTPSFYLGGTNNFISGSGDSLRLRATGTFELSSSNVQISSSLFRLKDNFTWNGTSLFISGSTVQVITPSFYFGSANQYISGSGGQIKISGSALQIISNNTFLGSNTSYISASNGNVKISGSSVSVLTPNFYLGGANNYISGSGGNVEIKTTNDFELSSSNVHISSSLLNLGNKFVWNGTSLTVSGSIYATSGYFSGHLVSTTGNIGGWSINSTTISKNNAVLDSTGIIKIGSSASMSGNGIFLSGSGDFNLQADSNNYIRKGSNKLLIKTTGEFNLSSSNVHISSSLFKLGSNFSWNGSDLSITGSVKATSGEFTGKITAGTGEIAGWKITDKYIDKVYTIVDISETDDSHSYTWVASTGSLGTMAYGHTNFRPMGFGVGYHYENSQAGFVMMGQFPIINSEGDNGYAISGSSSVLGLWARRGATDYFKLGFDSVNTSNYIAQIAGWDFDATKFYKNNIELSSTGYLKIGSGASINTAGIFLSGSGEFNIQSGTNEYIRKSGSTLEIKSTNVTLSSSNVSIITPNFYLGDSINYLSGSGGNISIKTNTFNLSSSGVQLTDSVLNLGDKFSWNGTALILSGSIYATSGYFDGEIQSTTGTIGGWNIDANNLSKGGTSLTSSTDGGGLMISDSNDIQRLQVGRFADPVFSDTDVTGTPIQITATGKMGYTSGLTTTIDANDGVYEEHIPITQTLNAFETVTYNVSLDINNVLSDYPDIYDSKLNVIVSLLNNNTQISGTTKSEIIDFYSWYGGKRNIRLSFTNDNTPKSGLEISIQYLFTKNGFSDNATLLYRNASAVINTSQISITPSKALFYTNESNYLEWTPSSLIFKTQNFETDSIDILGNASIDGNAVISGSLTILGNATISGSLSSHPVITSAGSTNNSSGNVIQDLTFDVFGHTTSLTSVDLDDRYNRILAKTRSNIDTAPNILKLKLPHTVISSKMISFDIITYSSYLYRKVTISGYLYATNESWHAAKALHHNTSIPMPITFGKEEDNTAYVSFEVGAYYGVIVTNLMYGFSSDNYDSEGWTITADSTKPNITSHTDITTWTSHNDGAGSGMDADLLDGQHGAYFLDYNNFTNKPTIGNATITLNAGSGLVTGGSFTTNQTSNKTITISHADTSTQSSINNSNGNVIQDITLDGYGHITNLGSVDLDGRYFTETEVNSNFMKLHESPTSVDYNFITKNGITRMTGNSNGPFGTTHTTMLSAFQYSSGTHGWQLAGDGSRLAVRNITTTGNDITYTGSVWRQIYEDNYHPNADKLTTPRTISLSGDVVGSVSFDGSSNASITTTIQANSVALGTDTTGNYVAGVSSGAGISVSSTSGEGITPTITVSYLPAIDNREVKPNGTGITSTIKGIKPFFTSLGGMTGDDNTDYQDLLVFDTYSDHTGGNANAITLDKSDGSMRIWNAPSANTTWGTPQRVFADNYHPNADKLTTIRKINNTDFNGTSNITTALWGSSRNINIGDTEKPVNGSVNVSWSRSEIGITKANIDALDIDADTLDGLDSINYLHYDTFNGQTVNADVISGSTHRAVIINTAFGATNTPIAANNGGILQNFTSFDSRYGYQTFLQPNTANSFYFRLLNNNNWGSWNKIWTNQNDGTGSGLDADTLDSLHASSFLRSDANDTASGYITFSNGIDVTGTKGIKYARTHLFGSSMYDAINGCLIKTNIPASSSTMFELDIKGNTYSTTPPVDTRIQGYEYDNGSILNLRTLNNGTPIDVDVLLIDDYVCFHFNQHKRYQTYRFELSTHIGDYEITSVTNEAIPAGALRQTQILNTNSVFESRTLSITGTPNRITVTGGTQNLSANRTWQLDLPQDIHTGASPTFNNLVLSGSLTVLGSAFSASVETVLIQDNLLVINDGETGNGVSNTIAGIEINRGLSTDYQFIFNETSDSFMIGEIGSLQTVATRQDTPISTGVPYFNATENRLDTTNNFLFNGTNLILPNQASSTIHALRADRSISTNNGLTGGGNLTTNRTFGLTGQALALHNLSTSGIITRTGTGTVAARTLTGTTNQVTVTNGNGVSGNPTFGLPQNIHALATPTFSRLTLSHATGTAPLTVSSTTLVSNLNADLWDGFQFGDYLNQPVRTTDDVSFNNLLVNKVFKIGDNFYKKNITGLFSIEPFTSSRKGYLKVYPISETNSYGRLTITVDGSYGFGRSYGKISKTFTIFTTELQALDANATNKSEVTEAVGGIVDRVFIGEPEVKMYDTQPWLVIPIFQANENNLYITLETNRLNINDASLDTTSSNISLQTFPQSTYKTNQYFVGFGTQKNPAYNIDVTGNLRVDNLALDGNTLSSVVTDEDIIINPNGQGKVILQTSSTPITFSRYLSGSQPQSLIPGSDSGALIESPLMTHTVFGLRENDSGDSFSIISGGGDYYDETIANRIYDTVVLHARADGRVGINSLADSAYFLHVNGATKVNGTFIANNIKLNNNTISAINESGSIILDTPPHGILEIHPHNNSIDGAALLSVYYTASDTLNTLNTVRSNSAWSFGFGIKHNNGGVGYVSTADNLPYRQSAFEFQGTEGGLSLKTAASASLVPVGTVVPLSEVFRVSNNGEMEIQGSMSLKSSIIDNNSATVNSSAPVNISSISSAEYKGVFFDYAAFSGDNQRVGTVMVSWNGSNIEFTDFSTVDQGDTKDLVLTANQVSSLIHLVGTVTSGNTWTIRTMLRAI